MGAGLKDHRYKCGTCAKILDTQEPKTCGACAKNTLPIEVATRVAVDAAKKQAANFYRRNIVAIYSACGFKRDKCPTCDRDVWLVVVNGKTQPHTADGLSHKADCKSGHKKGDR